MKRIDGKTPFGGDYAEFHFWMPKTMKLMRARKQALLSVSAKRMERL